MVFDARSAPPHRRLEGAAARRESTAARGRARARPQNHRDLASVWSTPQDDHTLTRGEMPGRAGTTNIADPRRIAGEIAGEAGATVRLPVPRQGGRAPPTDFDVGAENGGGS